MDAEQFREQQRDAWNSVATAWKKWLPLFEEGAVDLNRWLIEQAGIQPGHRVLDIAFGLGEPSLSAARATLPDGSVLGIDLSPEMARLATERAAAAKATNVEFRAGDAQNLVFESEFDAAVCRWGIMLMQDPFAGLRSIHRALRPGARFATAVWAAPERAPLLSIPRKASIDVLGLPAPDPDEPGPFRLQRPGHLAELMREAGFRDITEAEVEVAPSYGSTDEFREQTSEMSSSMRKRLDDVDAKEQERFWSAVAEETEKHRESDGRIRLRSWCHCASGLVD